MPHSFNAVLNFSCYAERMFSLIEVIKELLIGTSE